MTPKDYLNIANAIRETLAGYDNPIPDEECCINTARDAIFELAESLALDVFKVIDPEFNTMQFMVNCGIYGERGSDE